jgi:hypothetical protein
MVTGIFKGLERSPPAHAAAELARNAAAFDGIGPPDIDTALRAPLGGRAQRAVDFERFHVERDDVGGLRGTVLSGEGHSRWRDWGVQNRNEEREREKATR